MSTFSLLIVDDDLTIVDMIASNINWRKLGITEVYTAYGGQMAIDCIQAKRPDVVLCDIEMPIKNGLDVLRWVHTQKIQTYFIFLTCFDSFEYAREAINLRAFHYLTKPCPLEEVERTVQQAVEELVRTNSDTRRILTNSDLFQEIWNGALPDEEAALCNWISRGGGNIRGQGDYRLVFVRVELRGPLQAGWDLQLFHYAFRHLMQESVLDQLALDGSLFTESSGSATIILFADAIQFSENDLLERCGNAMRLCREGLDCIPIMMVSESLKLWQIHSKRPELEFALEQLQLYPGEVDLARNVVRSANKGQLEWDTARFEAFLDTWNVNGMSEYLERYLDEAMFQNKGNRVEIVHRLHQNLLQSFYSFLRRQGMEASALFDSKETYELSRKAEQSIPGMLAFARFMLTRTHELVVGSHTNTVVRNAMRYIDEHFTEDISREDVAGAVCITPNYLSKLFRQETGKTLREYITERRMNEAKRRLLETDDSVTDVALDSGFGSISYFSTVFHKNYRMSPLSWRKLSRKKGRKETH